jgi:hypothetical protein
MPGVKSRFWPWASALLIFCTLSVGLATKKSVIGIEEPGAEPLPQVVPEEFLCNAGTKTLKLPAEST